jgi:hypothetical protein
MAAKSSRIGTSSGGSGSGPLRLSTGRPGGYPGTRFIYMKDIGVHPPTPEWKPFRFFEAASLPPALGRNGLPNVMERASDERFLPVV